LSSNHLSALRTGEDERLLVRVVWSACHVVV
jgi:hypothetical protein